MAKKLFSLLMALTLLAALALPAAFAEDYLDIINIADDNQSASYDLHKDTSVNGRNMLRGTVMEQLVPLSGAARFQQGNSNFTTISSVFQENFTSFCGKIITNLIK